MKFMRSFKEKDLLWEKRTINQKVDIVKNMIDDYLKGVYIANERTFMIATKARFSLEEDYEADEDIYSEMKKYDYVSKGTSPPMYRYDDGGVYRYSNHWGQGISSCHWMIEDQSKQKTSFSYDTEYQLGFCHFSGFEPNFSFYEGVEEEYEGEPGIYVDNHILYGYPFVPLNYKIIGILHD